MLLAPLEVKDESGWCSRVASAVSVITYDDGLVPLGSLGVVVELGSRKGTVASLESGVRCCLETMKGLGTAKQLVCDGGVHRWRSAQDASEEWAMSFVSMAS